MGLAPGETDLSVLLANLRPVLHPEPFVFVSAPSSEAATLTPHSVATFQESEGVTLILRQADADRLAVRYDARWSLITLQVHSSLAAVGFLATLLPPLAAAGISVNPVSAFHHDHLFVPWERREEALSMLQSLPR